MRIGTINSANFKGLWVMQDKIEQGRTDKGQNITLQEATYRPFSDETQDEIEHELKRKKKTIHAIYNYSSRYNISQKPSAFVVVKTHLGEPLDVTKKAYSEIKALEDTPFPKSDESQYCREIKIADEDIQKILDRVK